MGRVAEVIITSGIPGAGKSTWIRRNTDPYMTEIFSADDYFLDDMGLYRFDPCKLSEAHSFCLRSYAERLMTLSKTAESLCPVTLVVDNTNISSWEIGPYYSLATAYGIPARILRFIADPERALLRNVHGVDKEKIDKMALRMAQSTLPSFWNVQNIRDWE